MAGGVGDLVVNLGMNTRDFSGGLMSASRGVSGLSSTVNRSMSMIRGAMAPLLPLFAAVGVAMGAMNAINSARDAVAQQNKLQAVLTATGGAAGLTAGQISDMADELSSLTNFEDDAIVSAAGVLATFKEVKGDQFRQATELAADMASVLGGDLQGSVMQVGKALNDPTKGITALSRAGVSFTEQQKQQIKTLQASGNLIGAQKIILQELESEFGGAAKAMADPFVRMQNVIGNVGESLGMLLLPAFNAITAGVADIFAPLAGAGEVFAVLGGKLGGIVSGVVSPFVSIFRGGIEIIIAGFVMLGPVIDGVGLLVESLMIGLSGMFQPVFDSISSLVSAYLPSVSEGFAGVGAFVGEVVGGIAFFFRNASALSQVAVIDLLTFIMDNVPFAETAFTQIGATSVGVFNGIGAGVKAFVLNVIAGFREIVNFAKAGFGAVGAAFSAMLSGENPLQAFQKSFVDTLSAQKDQLGGGNPFTEFQTAFNEGRDGFLAQTESKGGLKNSLADTKKQLLDGVSKNELAFSLKLEAPKLSVPEAGKPGLISPEKPVSQESGKYVQTEAVNRGSKEAFTAIQSFVFGGNADTGKQQLEVQKQQLSEVADQKGIMQQIRDGLEEDRAIDSMSPGFAI